MSARELLPFDEHDQRLIESIHPPHVEGQLARNDRALTDASHEAYARAYYRGRTGNIAGATMVAPHPGDMMGELVLALRWQR